MKKTVRLTEADLVRLVKRVVNEQEEGLAGYEGFLEAINNHFPNANWDYEGDDTTVFKDDEMTYIVYDDPTGTVEVSSRFANVINDYDFDSSYLEDWVEESLGVEVNDVMVSSPRRTEIKPDMSLSEFTKKYVSLQRALFKKLGPPIEFSIEETKMDAKEIYERQPGRLKEIINQMSEALKSI